MAARRISVFRFVVGWLHLWLGLISGIVVVIVSLTGCLFSFQEEISNVYYKKVFFIPEEHAVTLPLSALQAKAQAALGPSQTIEYMTTYSRPDRAWEFMAYKENDTAISYFGSLEYFRSAFVNPYTGEITGFRDYRLDFFNIVKNLHWSLLLSTPYGQPIVGWCTVIFVLMLITGLVLWYPKKWNRATKRQAFTIKWKAGFKRLNYDLHNVPGFYSLLIALVLALTGMVFSFRWFEKAVYVVASGSTSEPVNKEVKSIPASVSPSSPPMDIAFHSAITAFGNIDRINVSLTHAADGTLGFYGYRKSSVYYDYDALQYDQYSGKLLDRKNDSEKNAGEKLLSMNFDIHVGAIGGLAGKIIAFIVSLICASLPVTGFLIWLNKRKKAKSPPVSKNQHIERMQFKTSI